MRAGLQLEPTGNADLVKIASQTVALETGAGSSSAVRPGFAFGPAHQGPDWPVPYGDSGSLERARERRADSARRVRGGRARG